MIHQPNLSPVPGKDQYCLLDDYRAKYGNIEITVPAYFLFDGASIPWFGWLSTYTPFHPDVMAAAIVHDWLFLTHQVDIEMANQIFYDRLILNGAGKFKSKLMFKAVSIGAKQFWELRPEKIEALQLLYIMIKKNPNFEDYCFPEEIFQQRKTG